MESGELNKDITPLKISEKILIDGNLDEPSWKLAETAGDFVQFQPEKGKEASFRTEVKILYSAEYIYFGIICEDKEPEKIISRLSKRDADLGEDDSIGIGIDTFLDRRTAYFFFTNPLGTQLDGRISDNGRTTDSTWDEKWLSSAKKTSTGWNAEIAIPLSILKYKPGKDLKWGLGFLRYIPRLMEKDTWTGPMETTTKVSQFGTMKNFALKKAGKNLKIIPHLITRFQKEEETQISAGVDIRYAISQSMSADLTINPDFATIEADEEQINLTRFELSLPEKRPFFLEGSEMYRQRIRTFYSRRISDITGGARVLGRSGGWSLGYLSALSEPSNGEEKGLYNVARVQRDLGRSNIGMVWADRRLEGDNQGSVSLDATLFFTPTFGMTAQFANSYGPFDSGTGAFFIRPS
ncbi:MAG: carbohydrate binding family 9 domain-containing protein, partial [Candidatus Aminicenantes bacterium]|nr:carbohydrate binding family 9 domain-containing protein [Candidatus Aminicenantes bacterium]